MDIVNADCLAYYTTHDVLTDPHLYAPRLNDLPVALDELHRALNGLLIHVWKVRAQYPGLLSPPSREVFVRHTARLLEAMVRLDPAPLSVHRPVERRAVVDCRHFAVLLCAVLRHRGVPARPRCGFASYVGQPLFVDHWVCEVWDGDQQRWLFEDADLQRHDVPADEFVTGARAWRLCRLDPSTAARYGDDATTRGVAVVRRNLVRDVAALNGFPSVSGDEWGLGAAADAALAPADLATLDRAAELAEHTDGGAFVQMRTLYEASAGLRVPDALPHFDYLGTHAWHTSVWRTEP